MQWRKLARSKLSSGRSRTRNMLCCGRRKDNGREALDLTASPLRAPPVTPNNRPTHPPPMVIQGDFRKVSGISSEIFKQIEAVENDHDASTAAALEHVERRGEMIVRILEGRHLGRTAADQAKRFLGMQDAKHQVQFVEIVKRPGQTLGLYIREGNGQDRQDGVFISRIALESAVYNSGCLKVGDEILAVNLVDVTHMSLDDVVIIMSIPRRLVLATRQRKGGKGGQGSPSVQPKAEHKAPPVVVIKRDLQDDEQDEVDGPDSHSRDAMRQRHTGDGREMNDSRSRLGLGLSSTLDRQSGLDRHSQQHSQQQAQQPDSNGLDLYYNSRPPDTSWGYQPPPPVITEQPKSSQPHFPQYDRSGYPNTLESLAEKVHSFGMGRRMSAGGQPPPSRMSSQQNPSSHYYVQHAGTGSRRIMPRSGSDQHLPHTEYTDYTSITQAGRHSLLRSSLKSGSTLSRYNQRFVDQAAVAAQLQSKYGGASGAGSQYSAGGSTLRRNRGSLDYSSDTEATVGSRSGYYYYRDRSGGPTGPTGHGTIPSVGRQSSLPPTDISTKFNSLPRDTRGTTRLAMNKRFADRNVSILQDEADGALSAPEMPSIRRDRDEYRQWLSRTPSTSAIYEQIRASRDVLNQQRAARFTYSAENIHDALKNMESGIYSSYGGRPGATSTLDRHFTRSQQPSIPARSLSTQHITTSGTLSSSRSPSMRRMRQLLDLDSVRSGAAPSPVPTPSGTLPRGQRQLDINPAEFLKYKIDKPGLPGGGTSISGGLSQLTGTLTSSEDGEPVSGMLWVHLLAGRGLRASTGTSAATTPVTPSGGVPTVAGSTGLRDLYCVLECDRVHKARTVVRTGDLVFDWDESFELDLVNNRELDLLIYSWDPQYRHKLCYKGSVYLPTLLKSGPIHQLALKIEPRGTLYLRLRYTDSQNLYRRRPLSTLTLSRTTPLFGVDLETVVNRENKTGGVPGGVATGLVTGSQQNIPIIVKRCSRKWKRRGLDIIGLYRLCGSATKKRILREAFERNSRSVDLSPDNVPDINVITGVLKDYLRELPEPLFSKCLYQMMVDALGVCLPDDPEGNAKLMFSILDCLPRSNRATLIFIMDHLALVVSASDRNKMNAQNLATALAPPLMLQSAETMTPTSKTHDLDYQQPISVLRYLLQIWPTPKHHSGRRGRPSSGPRGDSRSASQAEASGAASWSRPGSAQSRPSAAPSLPPPRSAASGQLQFQQVRGPLPQGPSHQILGPSSASKGLYRPLSPRVGPQSAAGGQQAPTASQGGPGPLKPRHVIVSSPGSPSSSSDSQSGSDSVKHCLPGRVSSPAIRASPSPSSSAQMMIQRSSPSVTMIGSSGLRHSPSITVASSSTVGSPATGGPRNSPSITSISRASPSLFGQISRSSSPAMQASSAGLNVTLGGPSPSFSSLSGLQSTISNMSTTTSNMFSELYTQPTTYASTNPFLTGAYMSYTPGDNNFSDKFNTIGSTKDIKSFFDNYSMDSNGKYSSKLTTNYETECTSTGDGVYGTAKYNTIGGKYSQDKSSYLTSVYSTVSDSKYSPSKNGTSFASSPQQNLSTHLNVEETPTPTSSIDTEDSNTREVGEKDVEGDGEQSD
ncbi:LOW QUALITY PROTEIN: rho GTPase-activating protein 100F [Anthonomus grandis grandis]|uniref:LOW QUALITY PROTEIN: rho GTPase-activating protein 100F n=1 Tax=Anthonomus grandis grandis TaxID=2921223 RepID=UPI0021659070|nr:LOW QUALITY PROTEIN: rho GTPase-activating protein 100F [Anthonomus grandis grandis]